QLSLSSSSSSPSSISNNNNNNKRLARQQSADIYTTRARTISPVNRDTNQANSSIDKENDCVFPIEND
ncbi:unnamed protein product, partial [Rotaria magnacalcarata]